MEKATICYMDIYIYLTMDDDGDSVKERRWFWVLHRFPEGGRFFS